MKTVLAMAGVIAAALCLPGVVLLALLVAVSGTALACAPPTMPSADAALAASAPIPDRARTWIALTKAACPDLPTPWIAAVMAQESSFHPTATAEDRNGGTRGLLQLNGTVWRTAYGAAWDADLDHNGVRDIHDPQMRATTAGRYLCQRLDGVRRLRGTHPDWPVFAQLSDLDALVIAHNAGEAWLPRYPKLPQVTETFMTAIAERATAWTQTSNPIPSGETPARLPGCAPLEAAASEPGMTAVVGAVAGDPGEVAAAVQRAQILARDRSGWLHWCDRLVCRAYGYTNSGYVSAVAHWNALRTEGRAHPRDRCPPTGSFLFWTTSGPHGHAALVTQADPGCDPHKTLVLTNMVLDHHHGVSGGAYIVSLTRIESGFVTETNYLGWTPPRCAGQRT